jgi:hypothetical protein
MPDGAYDSIPICPSFVVPYQLDWVSPHFLHVFLDGRSTRVALAMFLGSFRSRFRELFNYEVKLACLWRRYNKEANQGSNDIKEVATQPKDL